MGIIPCLRSEWVYTVKIESKVFGGIYFNDMGDWAKIVRVVSLVCEVRLLTPQVFILSRYLSIDIGDIVSNGTDASNQYRGCTALTTVPLFDLSSVTNAFTMFLSVHLA